MIIRRRRNARFTIIGNHIAEDDRLSFEAVGMLTYLLSRPDDWEVRVGQLCVRGGCGRDKGRKVLRALIEAGYVRRDYARSPDGRRVAGVIYWVYDEPQAHGAQAEGGAGEEPERQGPENPSAEALETDSQAPENLSPENPSADLIRKDTKNGLSPNNERERASAISDQGREKPDTDRRKADSGGRNPDIPDADLFERIKRWPTFGSDSLARALNAWRGMSHHERVEAERSVEAWLEYHHKTNKRTQCPALFTYFAERRWEALPRDKRSKPVRTAVTRKGKEFLALGIKLDAEGRSLTPLADALKPAASGFTWPVDDMPDADAIAAHTHRLPSDGDEAFAWGEWFGERGLDLGLDEPQFWLWLPERYPPGWNAERARAARAEAAAVPKISADTLQRMRELGVGVDPPGG